MNNQNFLKAQATIRQTNKIGSSEVERWEIQFNRVEYEHKLPCKVSTRVPIYLQIRETTYNAGLNLGANSSYTQISPDLADSFGNKYVLSNLLKAEGYERNDKVLLHYFSEEKTFVLIKKIDK